MSTLSRRFLVPAYVFWPATYLATLAVTMFLFWWIVLIGGNPIKIENVFIADRYGERAASFEPGEMAGVVRKVCATSEVGVQFFPALRSESGALFPLPGGLVTVASGCAKSTYAFVVPPLPPGHYMYVNTVRFQNNLVGRDEYTSYPPMEIEVLSSDKSNH